YQKIFFAPRVVVKRRRVQLELPPDLSDSRRRKAPLSEQQYCCLLNLLNPHGESSLAVFPSEPYIGYSPTPTLRKHAVENIFGSFKARGPAVANILVSWFASSRSSRFHERSARFPKLLWPRQSHFPSLSQPHE